MRGLGAINARCISPLSASCLGLQLREIEYSSEAHQNWFRNFICQVFENSNRAVVPIPKEYLRWQNEMVFETFKFDTQTE